MLTVYKYRIPVPLPGVWSSRVQLPVDAEILSAGSQQGELYIWALVDMLNRPQSDRKLYVFGTGHPFPAGLPPLRFVGTVHMPEEGLVWHVFEERS